jgi:hypothetical protein
VPLATVRGQFPYPTATDPDDVPADLQALADRLEVVGALFVQGTAAARGAANTQGRFYLATDTGVVSYDTGTAWIDLLSTAAGNQAYVAKADQLLRSQVQRGAAVQSLAAATETTVSWESVANGDASFFDAATPGRMTVPAGQGGLYLITAAIPFATVTTAGTIRAHIKLNAALALVPKAVSVAANDLPILSLSIPWRLAAGDFVQVLVYSSNARDISPFITQPFLDMVRIGT